MASAARLADVALLRKLTPESPALAQRILRAVSAAADSGRLWLGAASLLAVGGGRQGRRAAIEGLIAVGASSMLVNGPLKQITRRPRPGRGIAAPLITKRGRKPRTSSMPSGHATSAAAFAIAAGRRVPAAAPPMAGLAALVAWSSINAGRHYATDVAVGIAVGATVACAVRVLSNRTLPPPASVDVLEDSGGSPSSEL